MKLTHTWKTQSGLKVTAKAELILKETQFADGWNVEVDVCKKNFYIEVEGMGVVGYFLNRERKTVSGIEYSALCGKLAITQDNLDVIDSMIAEIERHPAWVAKVAADKKNMKESQEYEAHRAKMTKMMGY